MRSRSQSRPPSDGSHRVGTLEPQLCTSTSLFPQHVVMEFVRDQRVKQSTGIERVWTCGACNKLLLLKKKSSLTVAECSRVAFSPLSARSERVLPPLHLLLAEDCVCNFCGLTSTKLSLPFREHVYVLRVRPRVNRTGRKSANACSPVEINRIEGEKYKHTCLLKSDCKKKTSLLPNFTTIHDESTLNGDEPQSVSNPCDNQKPNTNHKTFSFCGTFQGSPPG